MLDEYNDKQSPHSSSFSNLVRPRMQKLPIYSHILSLFNLKFLKAAGLNSSNKVSVDIFSVNNVIFLRKSFAV